EIRPTISAAFIIDIGSATAKVVTVQVCQHGTCGEKVRNGAILRGIVRASPPVIPGIVIVASIVYRRCQSEARKKRVTKYGSCRSQIGHWCRKSERNCLLSFAAKNSGRIRNGRRC